MNRFFAVCSLSLAMGLSPVAKALSQDEVLALHQQLLTLDTHLDTPAHLVEPGFDIMARHSPQDSQVDVPKMNEGGLDGGFWAIYSPQGPLTQAGFEKSRDTALLRAMAIHKMVDTHPAVFTFTTNPAEAPAIAKAGKKVVFISMENAYPLGEDISLLATFYKMGLRMVGPVHFKNNQFGDSATDPDGAKWHGLSPLGKALVAKANQLGIVLDGSHSSDAVTEQMIALSKTPIMLSHSASKAIYDHPRNASDALIKKLAASGGVIQVNSYSSYLKALPANPERKAALTALYQNFESLSNPTAEQLADFKAKRHAIDAKYPPVHADFDDFMHHLLHILKVAGPKHVGIGCDWDGGGGVNGMMDVSALPKISARLLKAGYSKADLVDIWGNNALRVLKAAEDYAASLKP